MMNAGSKWRLYIPSDLAYGPNGARRSHRPARHTHLRRGAAGGNRQVTDWIMQSLIRIAAAAAMMAPAAAYCATPAALTEADSVSVAAATVMGGYMDQAANKAYPLDSVARARFIAGVTDAFNATDGDKAYSRGMLEGLRVMESLSGMAAATCLSTASGS